MSASDGLSIVAQFSFAITAIITVVGWVYVGRLADKREFRKEIREHIKELKAKAEAVRDASNVYWTARNDPISAFKLKAVVDSLSRHLGILRLLDLELDDMLMVHIRQYATGGDFEQKRRRHTAADMDQLTDIHGSIEDLLVAVDRGFYSKFKPATDRKWWQRLPMLPVFFLGADSISK